MPVWSYLVISPDLFSQRTSSTVNSSIALLGFFVKSPTAVRRPLLLVHPHRVGST